MPVTLFRHRGQATALFVLVGYGLMLWRGVSELRELREARADMDWLRKMLDASLTTTDQHDHGIDIG